MSGKIDRDLLKKISRHTQSLGWKYFFKGLPYERCAELPYIIGLLQNRFDETLHYLDIGSGDSPLPTFFLKHTKWDISCPDKFFGVQKQRDFAKRVMNAKKFEERFHIIEEDFLQTQFPPESFEIITNISVIEHFAGDTDSAAMAASAKLLKSGGIYILTTLINEGFYNAFFLEQAVYGEGFKKRPVFYQRHYDVENLEARVIRPAGLKETHRVYFGEYDFQGNEHFFQKRSKVVRILYQWARPAFAAKYISYRSKPNSRADMPMNTTSGVIVVLEK